MPMGDMNQTLDVCNTPNQANVQPKPSGDCGKVYKCNPCEVPDKKLQSMCHLNTLLALPGVTEEFIMDLRMTKEQEANIPFLAWF